MVAEDGAVDTVAAEASMLEKVVKEGCTMVTVDDSILTNIMCNT